MTNRENIMQMNDAEFFEILLKSRFFVCRECPYFADCTGIKCKDAVAEWLQKECKEATTHEKQRRFEKHGLPSDAVQH